MPDEVRKPGRGSRDVRWGFLGAGNMARTMARVVAAADGATVAAVASRDVERARAVADLAGAPVAVGSYEELVDHPDVDAVYIALANDSHLTWTLVSLAAGRPVLCEKPLGRSTAEVGQMISLAMEAGLPLVEATWYRWSPRIRLAERLLRDGEIGDVRRVGAGFTFDGADALGPTNYRWDRAHGGGALYDVGCYALSAALWAVGRGLPTQVVAAAERAGGDPTAVDLTTEAQLWWDERAAEGASAQGNGPTATVRASMAEPYRQWLTVDGTLGRLEVPGRPFSALPPDGSELVVKGRTITVEPDDPYRLMIENVSALIVGGDGWMPDLGQSHDVARLIDACFDAAGGAPAG